jgi:hypothetical protein
MGSAEVAQSFYEAVEGGDLPAGLAHGKIVAFEQFADTLEVAQAVGG